MKKFVITSLLGLTIFGLSATITNAYPTVYKDNRAFEVVTTVTKSSMNDYGWGYIKKISDVYQVYASIKNSVTGLRAYDSGYSWADASGYAGSPMYTTTAKVSTKFNSAASELTVQSTSR